MMKPDVTPHVCVHTFVNQGSLLLTWAKSPKSITAVMSFLNDLGSNYLPE